MQPEFPHTSLGGLPLAWYNLAADLPAAASALLHAETRLPLSAADLAPLFPAALIAQEFSRARWIEIPQPVREVLAGWRPTPLVRARRLERALGTPARIYFKNESVSPPGSHKLNTAVAQAYYAAQGGATRLVTETGAGQWGCSLALAGVMFGLACKIFMVRWSHQMRPYRAAMMRVWNAQVIPSPSPETRAGREVLAATPDSCGSLGIAISEAMETAAGDPPSAYAMGSVLNHVLLHQTVIGLEAKEQLEHLGERADVVVGCVGGGSNFAGLAFPFLAERLAGRPTRFIAAEPAACPTLSRGTYGYDYGGAALGGPLLRMHSLGRDFAPPPILAGGLRYHGMAPLVSQAAEMGLVEPRAYPQQASFAAARQFASTEGTIPALETAYAIRAVIDEADRCRRTGEPECLLFCLSGHGLCELGSYSEILDGAVAELEAGCE